MKEKFNFRIYLVSALISIVFLASLGKLTLSQPQFPNLERFWTMASPGNNFFPTYRQVENWAKQKARKDKKIVVLGGSSFMLGIGQPLEKSIGRYLQEELGSGYVVLNLAVTGGGPFGIGAYIASSLSRDGYDVVYVSNFNDVYFPSIENVPPYQYSYWQANAQKVFPSQSKVKNLVAPKKDQLLAEINQKLYFMELFNYISYNFIAINSTKNSGDSSLRPLKEYPEISPELEFEKRHLDPKVESSYFNLVKSYAEREINPKDYVRVGAQFRTGLKELGIPRTILVACEHNIRYRNMLDTALLKNYYSITDNLMSAFNTRGIEAHNGCRQFIDPDWYDVVHIVPSGALKLAIEMSGWIRENP